MAVSPDAAPWRSRPPPPPVAWRFPARDFLAHLYDWFLFYPSYGQHSDRLRSNSLLPPPASCRLIACTHTPATTCLPPTGGTWRTCLTPCYLLRVFRTPSSCWNFFVKDGSQLPRCCCCVPCGRTTFCALILLTFAIYVCCRRFAFSLPTSPRAVFLCRTRAWARLAGYYATGISIMVRLCASLAPRRRIAVLVRVRHGFGPSGATHHQHLTFLAPSQLRTLPFDKRRSDRTLPAICGMQLTPPAPVA